MLPSASTDPNFISVAHTKYWTDTPVYQVMHNRHYIGKLHPSDKLINLPTYKLIKWAERRTESNQGSNIEYLKFRASALLLDHQLHSLSSQSVNALVHPNLVISVVSTHIRNDQL